MTGKEYKRQMQRIEATFIKRYFEETLDEYWEKLKDVDDAVFKMACERIRENFNPSYDEPLPRLSTFFRYIDEIEHDRFVHPADNFPPLSQEQKEKQEEINRQGRMKVANKILNSGNAGSGAKQWARSVIERNGKPLEEKDDPEPLGDILTRI